MVDTKEEVSATVPVSATEQKTKFIRSPKGMILTLEIALCIIVIICKATSSECYLLWTIVDLAWAIIIFIIYGMELQKRALPWTDFFRAITGSLTLLITSILCISLDFASSGEVAGSIFGLLTAAVFGYDTFCIMKHIKELKEQGRDINLI